MNKLLIGVATYKRIEKLERLLKSLENQTFKNFDIHIVCDNNDVMSGNFLAKNYYNTKISVQNGHQFVIGAWNKVVNMNINKDWDGFIGLCDDVELEPNALEEIVKLHKEKFPDSDGVCGFKQTCPGHPEYSFKWFGQTLMGKKFIERYKEVKYQICCPDYYHFLQDEEMHNFATSINKFYNCGDAVLKHYHPGFIREEIDETHNIIRSGSVCPKNNDFAMILKREQAGYLWGRDFNLIGKLDI